MKQKTKPVNYAEAPGLQLESKVFRRCGLEIMGAGSFVDKDAFHAWIFWNGEVMATHIGNDHYHLANVYDVFPGVAILALDQKYH